MNAICDTTAKSETLSVKGCKVKITYAPADLQRAVHMGGCV
jgi:hypothetical protein